jgi:Zn-dependent protease with chaperone function
MINISGTYQLAGRSEAHPASAMLYETGQLVIQKEGSDELLIEAWPDNYGYGIVIPGLPVDIEFPDGALFIPNDSRFRWPGMSNNHRLAEWLESHWLTVLSSVIIVPLFMWSMVNYVLPAASHAAVVLLPDGIAESMGEQTLYILDETYFDPTELSDQQQQEVKQQWQTIVTQLNLSEDQYKLHFRKFDMGANAMALPDGSIIVTDDIVTLMNKDPNALIAVLLHEIGHVEYKHSLKMVAQTTATTMLFAIMLGDIEGAGEFILGASTGLLQSAFSRDMEREADDFSYENLPKFNISPAAFADAMTLLANSHSSADSGSDETEESSTGNIEIENSLNHWLQYLSSHPETQERINTARKKGEENSVFH